MKRWTALVPIKQGQGGKSRLAAALAGPQRADLAARMAAHVLDVLTGCGDIAATVILSPARQAFPGTTWARDEGRGLNAEIADFRAGFGAGPLLVVHADLPLLTAADIAALLEAAEAGGTALATDRVGQGTNALALADGRPFEFRFGHDSRAAHCAQFPAMSVVQRDGLSADLDTPDDLAFARAHGFSG